jgi:hypothetical protein
VDISLALLVREYLLAGHLIDRAGMPNLIGDYGPDVMRDVAIDEWMGASPIYSRRMQRLLGYEGSTVETMFKGIQFDIGSPPQYMDFRFRCDNETHGEFWLAHCGALMDVEPMGDDLVRAMCHSIEDPTFDATACATNPRARVRPIHRPPRAPADRHPHCHWTVVIDEANDALPEPAAAVRIAATRAAALPVPVIPAAAGARTDYRGPLVEDLPLEEFSDQALQAIAEEVCLQAHLLVMSYMAAVSDRYGPEVAARLGRKQFTGVGGVVGERLVRALGLDSGYEAIAALFAVHPAFRPAPYVTLDVSLDDRLVIELRDCEALAEPRERNWLTLLATDPEATAPLDAIARAVDARARCVPLDGRAWEVVLDDDPHPESDDVTLTKFSTGAAFEFQPR